MELLSEMCTCIFFYDLINGIYNLHTYNFVDNQSFTNVIAITCNLYIG